MNKPEINSRFVQARKRAASEAEAQETHAQELLLGRLTRKAASDPAFRQELRDNPDKVVKQEAEGLQVPVARGVVEAAGRVLNAAVPGADAQRVQDLVFTTIDDMRKSFQLTLQLSTWLFIAGLCMIAVAFLAALFSDKLWAVAVSGGSGALSLLLSAVINPLDRIRNAAGNLAQIQAAYLGFYKQLYMLGVGVEGLLHEDAIRFSDQIQKAATAMVDSVGSALEKTQASDRRTKIGPPKLSKSSRAGKEQAPGKTSASSRDQ